MNSVHSSDLRVTITGNMVTRHDCDFSDIKDLFIDYNQMTIVKNENGLFDVSAPMDDQDRWSYAALIHRLNSENKLGKKLKPREDGDGPDGPSGGTPGAANQLTFENTLAVAA